MYEPNNNQPQYTTTNKEFYNNIPEQQRYKVRMSDRTADEVKAKAAYVGVEISEYKKTGTPSQILTFDARDEKTQKFILAEIEQLERDGKVTVIEDGGLYAPTYHNAPQTEFGYPPVSDNDIPPEQPKYYAQEQNYSAPDQSQGKWDKNDEKNITYYNKDKFNDIPKENRHIVAMPTKTAHDIIERAEQCGIADLTAVFDKNTHVARVTVDTSNPTQMAFLHKVIEPVVSKANEEVSKTATTFKQEAPEQSAPSRWKRDDEKNVSYYNKDKFNDIPKENRMIVKMPSKVAYKVIGEATRRGISDLTAFFDKNAHIAKVTIDTRSPAQMAFLHDYIEPTVNKSNNEVSKAATTFRAGYTDIQREQSAPSQTEGKWDKDVENNITFYNKDKFNTIPKENRHIVAMPTTLAHDIIKMAEKYSIPGLTAVFDKNTHVARVTVDTSSPTQMTFLHKVIEPAVSKANEAFSKKATVAAKKIAEEKRGRTQNYNAPSANKPNNYRQRGAR